MISLKCRNITIIIITIIVLIVILFIFSIYKLTTLKKRNIGMSGGDNVVKPNYKLPQVVPLTQKILSSIKLDDYVWLEKTDGERYFLIIQDGKIYKYENNGDTTFIKNTDITTNMMLDTEFYKNIFYIFDIPSEQGNYISRMINGWKKVNNSLFKLKKFNRVTSLTPLIEKINTEYINKESGNIIDGVVIQSILPPYKNTKVYKIKSATMTTNDFLMKLNDGVYSLWVSCTDKNIPTFRNKITMESEIIEKDGRKLVKFSSPYFINVSCYDPNKKVEVSTDPRYNYFPERLEEINNISNNIRDNIKKYDGKIVEMSYNGNQLVPMRVREDKEFPNSYFTVSSNFSTIFSPLTDEIYFHSSTSAFSEDVINVFHEANQTMRKYIIEKCIDKDKYTCIDLAGGRGADLINLCLSGCDNIFCEDSDSYALVTYVGKASSPEYINKQIKDYKTLIGNRKDVNNFYVNAICGSLSDNNEKIIEDIKSRVEWNKDGADVILMNYAIHYLCDNDANITELLRTIKSLISKNGVFIFSYFDGDRINELLNGKSEIKLGEFNIYRVDDKHIKMPLPTIDSSGYREEPISLSKTLNILGDKFKEIKLYEECEKYCKDMKSIEKISEYLKLIRVRIYNF